MDTVFLGDRRNPAQPASGVGLKSTPRPPLRQRLGELDWLESEAIHILREVAAGCSNPALLFSGGKDSIVLLRIAEKAFRPGRFPFPLLHIDTGHNFPEVIAFRDHRAQELGERLIVHSVEDSIAQGRVVERPGESRNALQSVTLLDAIAELGLDACIGGARRDARAGHRRNRRDAHYRARCDTPRRSDIRGVDGAAQEGRLLLMEPAEHDPAIEPDLLRFVAAGMIAAA